MQASVLPGQRIHSVGFLLLREEDLGLLKHVLQLCQLQEVGLQVDGIVGELQDLIFGLLQMSLK